MGRKPNPERSGECPKCHGVFKRKLLHLKTCNGYINTRTMKKDPYQTYYRCSCGQVTATIAKHVRKMHNISKQADADKYSKWMLGVSVVQVAKAAPVENQPTEPMNQIEQQSQTLCQSTEDKEQKPENEVNKTESDNAEDDVQPSNPQIFEQDGWCDNSIPSFKKILQLDTVKAQRGELLSAIEQYCGEAHHEEIHITMDTPMSEALKGYGIDIKNRRGKGKDSLLQLIKLVTFLDIKISVGDMLRKRTVTCRLIPAFQQSEAQGAFNTSTQYNHLQSLTNFCVWLEAEEEIDQSVVVLAHKRKVWLDKQTSVLRAARHQQEIRKMHDNPQHLLTDDAITKVRQNPEMIDLLCEILNDRFSIKDHHLFIRYRDAIICRLMSYKATRPGAIYNMTRQDIRSALPDSDEQLTVKVFDHKTKKKGPVIFSLSRNDHLILVNWVDKVTKMLETYWERGEYIFKSGTMAKSVYRQMTSSEVQVAFRKLKAASQLEVSKFNVTVLRKSTATSLHVRDPSERTTNVQAAHANHGVNVHVQQYAGLSTVALAAEGQQQQNRLFGGAGEATVDLPPTQPEARYKALVTAAANNDLTFANMKEKFTKQRESRKQQIMKFKERGLLLQRGIYDTPAKEMNTKEYAGTEQTQSTVRTECEKTQNKYKTPKDVKRKLFQTQRKRYTVQEAHDLLCDEEESQSQSNLRKQKRKLYTEDSSQSPDHHGIRSISDDSDVDETFDINKHVVDNDFDDDEDNDDDEDSDVIPDTPKRRKNTISVRMAVNPTTLPWDEPQESGDKLKVKNNQEAVEILKKIHDSISISDQITQKTVVKELRRSFVGRGVVIHFCKAWGNKGKPVEPIVVYKAFTQFVHELRRKEKRRAVKEAAKITEEDL